jgi:dihydropteroate synthase
MEHKPRVRYRLTLRGDPCLLGERTFVMGVLNVTPDSFSDGGRFPSVDAAVEHGLALFAEGADIVDVGGESTRPGSAAVGEEEEIRRVSPVLEGLRRRGAGYLSVDTTKAEVAAAALRSGADLVNDVSGFRFDPRLPEVVARAGAPAVAMHLRRDFAGMHERPRYDDVMGEVVRELEETLLLGESRGLPRERVIVDPGLGFAKDASHSLETLARLSELSALRRPILVGPSRKSFIGKVLDRPVGDRLLGTAAAVMAAVLQGAHMVRVHDVKEMVQVVKLGDALLAAPGKPVPA